MNISIIGTGYVGLVTGACLAKIGHNVTCVDLRQDIIAQINQGRSPIYEPGLDEVLLEAVTVGKLRATTQAGDGVRDSEITLICVGTPTGPSGADLSQIISAAESVGTALAGKKNYHVVAVKSTVLPGITEEVVKQTIEERCGRKLGDGWGLCMNPEFLREGRAIADFLSPDRIVIGTSDSRASQVILGVYAAFGCPKFITTSATAAMIKYVSNALFATMISFSNEIANMCSAIQNLDARSVWKGIHLDRRLTPMPGESARPAGVVEYLWHGLGFGGSCFPKDVQALREFGKQLGEPTAMLDAVLSTNASQPLRLVSLLEKEMDVAGRTVAVLGLAFKPGTDDLRESPALPVVTALRKHGARVIAHDPIAMARAKEHPVFEGVAFAPDWPAALSQADACLIVTAWPEYRQIPPEDFKRLMTNPLVIDGRGLFDPDEMARSGVKWRGLGYLPEKGPVADERVSAREPTEQRLPAMRASLNDFDFLELLHDTVIIRDVDGKIHHWNRGAREMYGWTRDEAVGNVSHKLLQTTFPVSLEKIESDLHQKGLWEGQLVQTRKNGSSITVKSRWALKRDHPSHRGKVFEINQIRHYVLGAFTYFHDVFLLAA